LPNGPERQEVFRRFWANLYTQEYQNPLVREDADRLSIRTAMLRELEALEDEERRESGGRELVRPLTLYRGDGSLADGWDRLSPVTEVRVSALESHRHNVDIIIITFTRESPAGFHQPRQIAPREGP
jgi:hypothetical protein